MPRKSVQTIKAWSYSRWNTYEQCPRKLKYQAIDKLRIKENDAMMRGKVIHKIAECYVNGTMTSLSDILNTDKEFKGKVPDEFQRYLKGSFNPKKMPAELELFDEEFEQLAEMIEDDEFILETEIRWALTQDWVPCEYFAHNAWVRVVIDALVLNEKSRRATVIDYKTGKIRDGYEEQLELYAGATFALHPWLDEVKTELWYLDQGEIVGGDEETGVGVFTLDQSDQLIKQWHQRTKKMLTDRVFKPEPSKLCAWCDFSKAKGGPCEY